jgi:hypothetical protein
MRGIAMYWVEPLLGEATIKKRAQLYREIMEIPDERLRSNLEHSFYKFQSFLDEDLAPYLPKPPKRQAKPPPTPDDLHEAVRRARGGDPPVQQQGYA